MHTPNHRPFSDIIFERAVGIRRPEGQIRLDDLRTGLLAAAILCNEIRIVILTTVANREDPREPFSVEDIYSDIIDLHGNKLKVQITPTNLRGQLALHPVRAGILNRVDDVGPAYDVGKNKKVFSANTHLLGASLDAAEHGLPLSLRLNKSLGAIYGYGIDTDRSADTLTSPMLRAHLLDIISSDREPIAGKEVYERLCDRERVHYSKFRNSINELSRVGLITKTKRGATSVFSHTPEQDLAIQQYFLSLLPLTFISKHPRSNSDRHRLNSLIESSACSAALVTRARIQGGFSPNILDNPGRSLVNKLVHEKPTTSAELADVTGLARSVVNNYLNELSAAGLVVLVNPNAKGGTPRIWTAQKPTR